LEYLISFDGLNVSPERISLTAGLAADEAVLAADDIVLIGWFIALICLNRAIYY
jgi:hypothetical protein